MTYYLWKGKENEVTARVEYLKRVFHTHFLRCADEGDFVCLKSFPFRNDGLCFVTGHTTHAHALLSNGLQGETIVLNCCCCIVIRLMCWGKYGMPIPLWEVRNEN